MKLKITQKGFENYTGQMGMVLFKDGLSVNDVPERVALRLAALFLCEWESNEPITITCNAAEMRAPIGRQTFLAKTDGKPEKVAGNDGRTIYIEPDLANAPIKITKRYTLAELEAIADKDGIKGLRDVGSPLGVRGTSINGLIEEILRVAGKEEEMPEGVEVVEG